MKELLKPSRNPTLKYVQRCVITPTYVLFTPYILDQGNRILREFLPSIYLSMLCGFKMDNFEEGRWGNKFLIEYIKFILKEGIYLGEKNFKFFNFSQSQFRNMSCWLLTHPEKIIPKLGDFSKIKQISKYGARISQTLTTTIKTITIPKDKIEKIKDIKSEDNKYTFSDGVGRISVVLSDQISEKLKLYPTPSCFQGRFLGCKGVWTTMWNDKSGKIYCRDSQIKFEVKPDKINNYFELCDYSRYIQSYLNRQIIILLSALGIEDKYFEKKLNEYKNKLNDQKFVLSLIHYTEWNQMFHKMNSCGINRINDRLSRSIIESNLDILYNDIKKKARIYVEESAYVIGIMDEYNILEYGEAYLQIKRDNFNIILDKKCTVAKCPCLHPGDIRVLRFRKYNKNNESTKKYEVFNNYENVIIFPSKGKRPHPDECSGSDLDGDNYFVFYDNDLIPEKTVEPMSYLVEKKEENKNPKFTINDVIDYFAEYTNYNNLGLIGDAHLAISDKKTANSDISLRLAKKFSKAVDAPKTGEKITLDEDESPKEFPHYMEKNKRQSYTSKNILGRLYDKSCEFISKRIKLRDQIGLFYDKDLKINNWEKYAFLGLIYYRDYFNDLVNLLTKNEINGESVLLTGNNIDNDNSLLTKKKHNYDLREKIGNDIHNLFIQNKDNFYDAIKNLFINKKEIKNENKNENKNRNYKLKYNDLINNELYFQNNLNLFASACYMISYNIIEDVLNKISSVSYYCKKFQETINDNLIMNNDFEELSEISEYESINLGVDNYESYESNYNSFYEQINEKKETINSIINKNEKDMINFVERLRKTEIPKQSNQENKYRILSFPWCISGQILSSIKIINFHIVD
jgi:RNA-dependent RNA polymerase